MSNREAVLPWVAAAVTMLMWASSFVVIRGAADDLSPGAMALWRQVTALVALTFLLGIRRPALPSPRGVGLALVYGALWFGLYTWVLNMAEHHLDAGTAAMLVNMAPLLVALGAGTLLGEGFPPRLLSGMGVSFAGVVLIAWGSASGRDDVQGVLLGLICAVLYATGVLLQKVVLREAEPLAATWWAALGGTVTLLPCMNPLVNEWSSTPTPTLLWVAYTGVFSTALGFSLYAYAQTHLTAGALSASSYLVPALAVAMAALALGEMPGALPTGGGVLCLLGVGITRWPVRSHRHDGQRT